MQDKANWRTRGPLPKKCPKIPLEIGMNDSRCKACGKLIVGKESDDLGNHKQNGVQKVDTDSVGRA